MEICYSAGVTIGADGDSGKMDVSGRKITEKDPLFAGSELWAAIYSHRKRTSTNRWKNTTCPIGTLLDTHKALRVRVAQEDTSIQKWVEALIERELGLGPKARRAARK